MVTYWLRWSVGMGLFSLAILSIALLLSRLQTSQALEYIEAYSDGRLIAAYYLDIERLLVTRRTHRLAALPLNTGATGPDGWRVVSLPTPGNIDLFIVPPDEPAIPLTHFSDFPARGLSGDARRANLYPLWSPDYRWIVFLSSDEVGHMDLYAVRPDGSDLRRLAYRINTQGLGRPMWVRLTGHAFAIS
jgi:hypothetical protein